MPISDRLVAAKKHTEDDGLFPRIRPLTLADYLGQASVSDNKCRYLSMRHVDGTRP